jgi:hypothetical protein
MQYSVANEQRGDNIDADGASIGTTNASRSLIINPIDSRGARFSHDGFSIGTFLFGLIGAAFAALIWRVVCELWIVTFSINDRLGTLVELKKAEKQ